MSKILLASVYYHLNYGSILQSYATQMAIQRLGYESKTINCKRINRQIKKRKICYYFKNINHISMFFSQIKKYTLKFRRIFDLQFSQKYAMRLKAMRSFQDSAFDLTFEVSVNGIKDLCTEDVKAVVVGSDQLWLPSNIAGDFFTLNNVPDFMKKVAYGTSFGIEELPDSMKKHTQKFLSLFSNVSVREESGKRIIKQLIKDIEVKIVCDPTILIEAEVWKSLMPSKKIIDGNYIFCYFLGSNPKHRELARKYADEKKLNIVTLPNLEEYIKADNQYADVELYDISPLQFLNLINFADEIYTDSFHGTVFSILFHKTFYTLRRFKQSDYVSTNTRIENLLEILDLKTRLIDDILIYRNWEPIDYQAVDKRIIDFRNSSLDYLSHALE